MVLRNGAGVRPAFCLKGKVGLHQVVPAPAGPRLPFARQEPAAPAAEPVAGTWCLAEPTVTVDFGLDVGALMLPESITGEDGLCRMDGEVLRATFVKHEDMREWLQVLQLRWDEVARRLSRVLTPRAEAADWWMPGCCRCSLMSTAAVR